MQRTLLVVAGVAILVTIPRAQTKSRPDPKGAAVRTSWGTPDLQGVWRHALTTPWERPAEFAGRELLTADEVAAAARLRRERGSRDRRDGGVDADVSRDYNDFWDEEARWGVLSSRTSAILDPPDGKLPPLTPAGEDQRRANAARLSKVPDSWLDRTTQERCLSQGANGPPMLAFGLNEKLLGNSQAFQIVQTPEQIVIHSEAFHQARVIALDGRPHLPSTIRQWFGDSRGHWEGQTLVVDTTNFNGQRSMLGINFPALPVDEYLHLIERFARKDANTIDYRFTVDDQTMWTTPWTATVSIVKLEGNVFEYACHEGNRALPNILRGARRQENAGAPDRQ